VAGSLKEIEEKTRSRFQSDNQKTKEIKYKAKHPTKDEERDSVHLKTIKNTELDPPNSTRKNKEKDIVIEFKEKIVFNTSANTKNSEDPKRVLDLNKKKSVAQKDRLEADAADDARASRSEGKPPKIGISL
jgi:hypothetical protein